MITQQLIEIVNKALKRAFESGVLPSDDFSSVAIEEPKHANQGDFSTNTAMTMAAVQKMAPRKIAQAIVNHIEDPAGIVEKVEIAGPGFINFFIRPSAWLPVLSKIHEKNGRFGAVDIGRGRRVQVEFVSANPTGPLHIGHGRGAAVGDAVANILAFCGYEVSREYYINDSGRQINTLGKSVFLRYKEKLGEEVEFPEDCYQGDYIKDLAGEIFKDRGDSLLSVDFNKAVDHCARFAADKILAGIREDLDVFGVHYDRWFSEQTLFDSGQVENTIARFIKAGQIYQAEGAKWFASKALGDEKDRVVVRKNGQTTYFASDIAYHLNKFERGLNKVIDVWGADHHGYVARVSAVIDAAGYKRDQFAVILVQLVNLMRGGQPVAMSTRAGEFVTLKDVLDEVGSDAARFIFLTRHYDSPLDFDLEIAKKQTNENPVYYVQYVHARIASIRRKNEKEKKASAAADEKALALLTAPEELTLIKNMARYPEVVEKSARLLAPHGITFFLMGLAAAFHAYYNKQRVLSDDPLLSSARLHLVVAVQKVIKNGLTLLGVSAPESM